MVNEPKGRCECVTCSTCSGRGVIVLSDAAHLGRYDSEEERCGDCTDGIVEECDYCQEQRERDETQGMGDA